MLIHGDSDDVVSPGEGKPSSFLDKNIDLTLPGLAHELALSSHDQQVMFNLSNKKSIHIPDYIPNILRNIFFSTCGEVKV
ncbi:MAG: hypothetical protein WAU01_00845 [Saprospiraceae bacterium]